MRIGSGGSLLRRSLRWSFSFLILSLACFFSASAEAETPLSDSLSRLRETGQQQRPFSFAIAGNTRHVIPYVQSPEFETILSQVSSRKPAFLVLLGDLIRGENITTAPRQWDEFLHTIGNCQVPPVALPGEHDIWSQESRHLWEERLGARWYSFDYGASHFIFLDTQDSLRGGIGRAQLKWLEKDLAASKQVKSIFVFVHQPLFFNPISNWESVHRLLCRYPVKAVFAAHQNLFENLRLRDGIAYYVTGGGSAEAAAPPEVGGFEHWLLVTVEGANYRVVVMRPTGEALPPEVTLRANLMPILAARREIKVSEIEGRVGENLDAEVSVSFGNPSAAPLSGRLEWHSPSSGWIFDKYSGAYEVPGHGEAELRFRVKTENPEVLMGPLPHCSLDYYCGYELRSVRLTRGLPLVRNMDIPRAPGPVVVDGKLDEWQGVEGIALVNRLGSEPESEADISASVRMMWSPRRLFIAVEVRDDIITMPAKGAEVEWDVDSFSLFVNPLDEGQATRRQGIYNYVGYLAAEGPRMSLMSDLVVTGQHRPAPNVRIAAARKEGITTYEMVFDDASLSPLLLEAGEVFALNLLVGDDDGPRHPEKFTLLALAGSGSMKGEAWPHIVAKLKP